MASKAAPRRWETPQKGPRMRTIEDAVASRMVSTPEVASASVIADSPYETMTFFAQVWHLGKKYGRTGWPAKFEAFGQQLNELKHSARNDPQVIPRLTAAVYTLIGLGFTPEDTVNILSGLAYDVVTMVRQNPMAVAQGAVIGGSFAEVYQNRVAKSVQNATMLNAGALRILNSYQQTAGSPGEKIGGLTGVLFDMGRAATAPVAGATSWYSNVTIKGPTGMGSIDLKKDPSAVPVSDNSASPLDDDERPV